MFVRKFWTTDLICPYLIPTFHFFSVTQWDIVLSFFHSLFGSITCRWSAYELCYCYLLSDHAILSSHELLYSLKCDDVYSIRSFFLICLSSIYTMRLAVIPLCMSLHISYKPFLWNVWSQFVLCKINLIAMDVDCLLLQFQSFLICLLNIGCAWTFVFPIHVI